MKLSHVIERARVVVVVGPGGVGKTTASAALALAAARAGRRVLVLTADPARRLADALGLPRDADGSDKPVPVPVGAGPGRLDAAMVLTGSSYDRLIARLAPSPRARQAILDNPMYRAFSRTLARSHAYVAMERLHDALHDGRTDLVVLDTPPSRHALDFLNAPSKLRAVLEEGVLNWLLKPSSFLLKRVQRKAGVDQKTGFLDTIERLLGLGMIRDLSEFVVLFKDMLDDFRNRAAGGQALLSAEDTRFVLVTAPRRVSAQEATFFLSRIEARGFHFGGFVVNRVLPLAAGDTTNAELQALRALTDADWRARFPTPPPGGMTEEVYARLQDKLRANLETLPAIAEIDRQNMRWLHDKAGAHHLFVRLPELPFDVHDLDGLNTLGRLFRQQVQVALPRDD